MSLTLLVFLKIGLKLFQRGGEQQMNNLKIMVVFFIWPLFQLQVEGQMTLSA